MKRIILLLMLFLVLPIAASAAQFTAAVERGQISDNQTLVLDLTLTGADPQASPDLSALERSFSIVSQEESSNISAINNAVTANVGWQVVLAPRQSGQLTIPSVSVRTSAGILTSQPILVDVTHVASNAPSRFGSGSGGISVFAIASTTQPYQNQPILYTIKCVVGRDISNLSLSDLTVPDAIVQQQGKPVVYDEDENGVPVKIIAFHYVITPLKPGTVTIPAVTLQGSIAVDPFADADIFTGGLSSMLRVFNELSNFAGDRPFHISTNPTQVTVKAPAARMDPWLPLVGLKLKDDIEASGVIHAGEPIMRKISLFAQGAVGSQLPDLESQEDHRDFRVYPDKPTTGQDVDDTSGVISGWRKESYSLIAQKPGRFMLPPIKVSWWDVVHNRIAQSELPERAIAVLPGAVVLMPAVATRQPLWHSVPQPRASVTHALGFVVRLLKNSWQFLVLLVLLSTIAAMGAGVFVLSHAVPSRRDKRGHLDFSAPAQPDCDFQSPRSQPGKSLGDVTTLEELKAFIVAHAGKRFGVPENLPLAKVIAIVAASQTDKQDAQALLSGLEAGLYGGKTVPLEDLKILCRRVFAAKNVSARNHGGLEKLPRLNPT